jgi:hypothetical protein
MFTQEKDRFESLKGLSPVEAIRTWLCDNCTHGERGYLVAAIQRDRRIELDDDEIAYVIESAIEDGIDATTAFDRLLTAGDGFQVRNMSRLPAR